MSEVKNNPELENKELNKEEVEGNCNCQSSSRHACDHDCIGSTVLWSCAD